ncbi:hypothetical protein [Nannocystis radixulma]|uniref:Lipoprotein n=1 Tax=Nannocystis radixulma TaxID=2995305 RepID=A0ABT5BLA8_9BACT|nr:hypothetical protein [Nannocystis radixulma]MDC0674940.1 hypothetical protein [Nannocystis radixulma]
MHKNFRTFLASSFLFAAGTALALTACDDHQGGSTPESQSTLLTPAELGLGDGWTELDRGLWSRPGDDGQEEFVGIGVPGKLHGLASLQGIEESLQIAADTASDDKAQAQLAEIRALIVDIENFEVVDPVQDAQPRCTLNLYHSTTATPQACGVKADASVNYSYPCSAATETVYTYTYAKCGVLTTTHTCGNRTGNPVACSSASQITGVAPCESYALAQSNYYSTWKINNIRGTCGSDGGGTTTTTGDSDGDSCGPCQGSWDCHCVDRCWPAGQPCP